MNTIDKDITFLKTRIEELEKEQGVKIQVDKENIKDLDIEDLARIAYVYGVSLRKFFNP